MPGVPDAVRTEVADHVAVVTLDRPPVNAVDWATMDTIAQAFHRVAEDPSVRCAVLSGAGRMFCVGSDMKARGSVSSESAYNLSIRAMLDSITDCPVPVVAAVNGHALGGGLALVAACDLVVASREAAFAIPEIDVGLLGGSSYAARLVGRQRARRMLLTGVRIGAEELHRAGVLDLCVAPGEVLPTAMSLAGEIASKSPTAVRLAKRSLNAVEDMPFRDGYRHEQTYTRQLRDHPHSAEAMAAFNEKRPPVFEE
jgi:enoyl-CoA hydratase